MPHETETFSQRRQNHPGLAVAKHTYPNRQPLGCNSLSMDGSMFFHATLTCGRPFGLNSCNKQDKLVSLLNRANAFLTFLYHQGWYPKGSHKTRGLAPKTPETLFVLHNDGTKRLYKYVTYLALKTMIVQNNIKQISIQ